MKKSNLITSIIILALFVTSCGPKFKSAEYVITSNTANAEEESQTSLIDNASISIPPKSINGNATIKVERNPEKIKDLPPLPDGMVQLSDFYNFEIEGADLIGPVDITIPVDETKLPKEDGIPFAMIPTNGGWKYIPVEIKDGKASIYTDEIGDPLIAWHFTDPTWTEEEIKNGKYICDPEIPIQAVDNGDGTFQIIGQVIPPRAHTAFDSLLFGRKPAAGLPVSISLNLREPGSGKNFNTVTDDNGNFELTLDVTSGIREGWNWIFANANCDPWFLEVSVESKGYVEFRYTPIAQNPPETTTEVPTEIPVAQPESAQPPKTPTEYVLLPNVIGLPFDTAKGFLERIGYKVIWIDGKSTFEIGQVYSQSPKAGTLTVPHRTTIVLYRTTEKRELTSAELLIKTLKHVSYETSTCYKFNEFEAQKEDCHLVIDITNRNGQIHEYYTYYHGEKSREQDYTISPSITTPLDSIAGYWWIPNIGNLYEVEESLYLDDYDVYSGSPAYSWNPGGIVSLSVAGYTFTAQEYSTNYNWIYDDRQSGSAWKVVLEFHRTAYYDIETGLLLKSESDATYLECVNSYSHPELYGPLCSSTIGQTESNVFELTLLEKLEP